MQLKEVEKHKIEYAKKHFESLGHENIKFDQIDSYESLMNMVK